MSPSLGTRELTSRETFFFFPLSCYSNGQGKAGKVNTVVIRNHYECVYGAGVSKSGFSARAKRNGNVLFFFLFLLVL